MTPFALRIYDLLRSVPAGHVTTYRDLAHAAGSQAYRAVGQAMRHNPYAPQVPCHRVVSSTGKIGGFMGKTGGTEISKKISLLRAEGVEVSGGRIRNFTAIRHTFSPAAAAER